MKFVLSLLLSIAISFGMPQMTAASAATERPSVKLPVLMYHRILKNAGDIYTISPNAFEQDLIYLRDNGYTTVGTKEILDFAENGTPLPEKPIFLTFDDGFYNNIHYAAPLLEKYCMKAAIFVVGQFSEKSTKENVENPSYSYITWERMEKIPDCFEIQNHTWDMHRLNSSRHGIRRKSGESRDDYARAFSDDLKKLNEKVTYHTGKTPVAFAIPFGAEESWAYPVLLSGGMKMCVCSEEGVTTIKSGEPESLHRVKRVVRGPSRSAAAILKKLGV